MKSWARCASRPDAADRGGIEGDSRRLRNSYRATEVANRRHAEDAVRIAERIGDPVVLKLHSETITHKTEVGGVGLNLHGDEAIRAAFRPHPFAQRGRARFSGVTVQPMIAAARVTS